MSVITQFLGNSALMMAATFGSTEVVSLLLEAGANIDLKDKVMSVYMCKWFGRRYNLNRVVCEVT